MFGAGGGTSSYREVEETDLIFLWGSNARETHPIFFHRVLKAVNNGARLFVVDPRRTGSAQWADTWLGLDVGSDVALSNAMARVIIHAGLHNRQFIDRATTGFEEYAASVEPYTLERAERDTGIPADAIRDSRARLCPRRPRHDLLDAWHHRAPQRGGQRLRADQPGASDRPCRSLRLGPEPAARPEQRAGRRRHGRDPQQAAGVPGHRVQPRGPGSLRGGLEHDHPAEVRLAPDADVRGDGARRAALALRRRREPGAVRGRRRPHAAPARRASTTWSSRTSS